MLCAMEADGVVKDVEYAAALRLLLPLDHFRAVEERDLQATLRRLARIRAGVGTERFLRACADAIPDGERPLLLRAAAAVVRADREILRNEQAFLAFLQSRLGVAEGAAEALLAARDEGSGAPSSR